MAGDLFFYKATDGKFPGGKERSLNCAYSMIFLKVIILMLRDV
jgi:hypothetical protein